MELPNYSQQLLRQLYTFCKEQQFCDCSILVGESHFQAHKLVLAAASLLLKSLLESTDTISIDASVVAPDDFALLLEMIYTGRLPLGKHNFTNIISVADSLQMFDVAVSCKALLRDLLSCSNQDDTGRDFIQTIDASRESTTVSNSSQAIALEAKDTVSSQPSLRVSPCSANSVNSLKVQGQTTHSTLTHKEPMDQETLPNSCSQHSEFCPEQGAKGICKERESKEPPEEKGMVEDEGSSGEKIAAALLQERKEELVQNMTELGPIQDFLEKSKEDFLPESEKQMILAYCQNSSPKEAVENLIKVVVEEKNLKAQSLFKLLFAVKASFPSLHRVLSHWEQAAVQSDGTARWNLEAYGKNLLRHHQATLAEFIIDPQLLQKGLSAVQHLAARNREVVEKIATGVAGSELLAALVSAALEEETLPAVVIWQVLLALQSQESPLKQFLEEVQKDPDADLFFQTVGSSIGMVTEIILRHRELVSEALRRRASLVGLSPAEVDLAKAMNELLTIDPEEGPPTASWKAVLSSTLGKSVHANQICRLLCGTPGFFPGLQPVMQELHQAGLLMEGEGGEADVQQRLVEKESRLEDMGHEVKEQKAEFGVMSGSAASKRSFTCKACMKSFRFYCHLQVHEKCCGIASQKHDPCKDGSKTRASRKELTKWPLETPGSASRKKKKKRLPVACDICGREFAHASGMQYHKLTEHFDEKPFSCGECGAKFAANSTLKNHQRLHSGDRPFVCKHCQTTFSQASALAYHTKKKHAEGKMYACQYCAAVFAQSIELSRHVRTHTGDKPYVCRECGKGFRQANGLSIHLRTFHNTDDPYDCKKCQMSFPTQQEHRKHIHTAHSREYHPCLTCEKIFSAPSLLERHMVTHLGGKPFSCEICDKAYQQLSGLWYHNRTHHPEIFASQNHRSSKFSLLRCSSCDKTFLSTASYRKHAKEEHADVALHECEQCGVSFPTPASLQAHMKHQHLGPQEFLCPYCSASFRLQETLRHHMAREHTAQAEPSPSCRLCGELFSGQEQLAEHCEAEHPKVVFAGSQVPTAHIVQVIQAPEQVIALTESELTGSHVFLTLPDAQGYQGRTELVTVTMEELLDEKVTLICKDAEGGRA